MMAILQKKIKFFVPSYKDADKSKCVSNIEIQLSYSFLVELFKEGGEGMQNPFLIFLSE